MSERFSNIRSKRTAKYVDPKDNKLKTVEIKEAKVEPATRPPIDMTDYGENFPEFRQRALDKAEFKTLKEKEAQEQKWPLSGLKAEDIVNLPQSLQQRVQKEWKTQSDAGEDITAHKAALEAIIRKYRKTKKLPEVGEPLDISELELQR